MQAPTTEPKNRSSSSRRGFLGILLGGSLTALAAAAVYPIVRFITPPKLPDASHSSVVAAKVGELQPNSGKIFRFGKEPGILIMTAGGGYRAFAATCTHLDCTVQFRSDLEHIWCACHNGHYDLNGRNISGPPPSPLESFEVTVRGEDIVVSKA
ncbi:MAG: Rieske 2Fe-2S domain-containing protein [Candidatus Eisenbacteria bacterium]|nr:Rieske 2Fe-2S domain-containing protein [Candidatus Eisenbacteria bacterium]